nr:MAG TPA: hypothetical protein [Caudoviricetes sp.]
MRSVHPLIFGNSLIYKQHNHVNPESVFIHFVLPPLSGKPFPHIKVKG